MYIYMAVARLFSSRKRRDDYLHINFENCILYILCPCHAYVHVLSCYLLLLVSGATPTTPTRRCATSLSPPLLHACIHSRTVCSVSQQKCQLCQTADMSAVSHSRHVCCLTQQAFCCMTHQTCFLCHTADMSAEPHSRNICCVTQQACLLRDIADMSAVSHSTYVCCVTQQTCLL